MITGAAGRWMRLTGSYSPDRMLTLQLLSRSESTRTSHSFPSQVALAMAAFYQLSGDGAHRSRRRRTSAPRDLRRVTLVAPDGQLADRMTHQELHPGAGWPCRSA